MQYDQQPTEYVYVCIVSCSYLNAIGDVDIELSVPTNSLDVSQLLIYIL